MRQVLSPAKINLYLDVGPKRKDGYHSVRTLMAKLDLADTLKIDRRGAKFAKGFDDPLTLPSPSRGEGGGEGEYCFRIDGNFCFCLKFVSGFPENCRRELLKNPLENLVVRAYELLIRGGFQLREPVCLTLVKRIPVGAGLGGGSSNAAAALKIFASLVEPRPTKKTLEKIATRLGSDVNFFLEPSPLGWATGRGEKVQKLPGFAKKMSVLIVYPGFGVSTKDAYRTLDKAKSAEFGLTKKVVLDRLTGLAERGDFTVLNAFEPPVFRKYPLLSAIKAVFKRFGARSAGLSGSGSTVFGIAEKPKDLDFWVKYFKDIREFKGFAFYVTAIATVVEEE